AEASIALVLSAIGPIFCSSGPTLSRAGPAFSTTARTLSITGPIFPSIGPACATSGSTLCWVLRTARYIASVAMAWTIIARPASATPPATTMRKTSSVTISTLDGFGRHVTAYRVAIGLLAGFHGIRQAVFLTFESVLAAIHPLGGGLLQFGSTLLQ